MSSTERVLIIVPAWNEEQTVGAVVQEVRATIPGTDVLVVDDGSGDRTAAVAAGAGADVLTLPYNLGVGGAMRAGYLYAHRNRYDRTIQLDADGQHDPAQVPVLLHALEESGADVVIGSRFAGVGDYRVRGPRRWAMVLLGSVLSRVTRTRLTDPTSGFKACGPRAVAVFARDYPAEYLGDTVEALVIAARAGLRVRQTGVPMRPRAGGRPSHGAWRSTVFLLRAVLALTVALTRPHDRSTAALEAHA